MLVRHLRRKTPCVPESLSTVCPRCGLTYSTRGSMLRHVRANVCELVRANACEDDICEDDVCEDDSTETNAPPATNINAIIASLTEREVAPFNPMSPIDITQADLLTIFNDVTSALREYTQLAYTEMTDPVVSASLVSAALVELARVGFASPSARSVVANPALPTTVLVRNETDWDVKPIALVLHLILDHISARLTKIILLPDARKLPHELQNAGMFIADMFLGDPEKMTKMSIEPARQMFVEFLESS